jgi:hypothetical protein
MTYTEVIESLNIITGVTSAMAARYSEGRATILDHVDDMERLATGLNNLTIITGRLVEQLAKKEVL